MAIDYSLRSVEEDDVEWLYKLNEDSYRDAVVRQFGDWDVDVQRRWFQSKWRENRPADIVMIGGERVGVVVLEQRDGYDWLDEILITPAYRGRGIGTSLIQQLIASAGDRNRKLKLQVLHKNPGARRIYERLGFETLETLEHHYLMEIDPLSTDR